MTTPLEENIIESLDLGNLPEEKRNEILGQVGEVINKRIMNRIVDELSDEELNEFDQLMGNEPTGDQIVEFLSSKIENFDSLVQEEVEKFKKESSDFMKKMEG